MPDTRPKLRLRATDYKSDNATVYEIVGDGKLYGSIERERHNGVARWWLTDVYDSLGGHRSFFTLATAKAWLRDHANYDGTDDDTDALAATAFDGSVMGHGSPKVAQAMRCLRGLEMTQRERQTLRGLVADWASEGDDD